MPFAAHRQDTAACLQSDLGLQMPLCALYIEKLRVVAGIYLDGFRKTPRPLHLKLSQQMVTMRTLVV